ncbi:tryptophan synthase, alpha subunit [Chloroherpeton thalassium ATCC 35110]|uniref:Tryptophan synthase alpha chain n=1 Tax=Chloroherpeton thalassium (strain ATCC 35110 / GB-78) TaxID=517418 RepID=B3QXQ9_CHLT3|nr:tryptophan synthase subunit alpha [Chloroherpeton thalassium]ACF14974.1 tryptophan synthase, alpha subunit [Chloroherpeton thalassium ATCC 35110]
MSTTTGEKSRISFLIKSNQKLLISYLMPEFPVRGATVPAMLALQNAGANMIELGVPHSDPLADGPVIQKAAQIALENGVNLKQVLTFVIEARRAGLKIPVFLMGYYNPLFAYGIDKFLADAVAAGVDGFIVPDLPPEESHEFLEKCKQNQLALTFLISPVTSTARIQEIDQLSTHFSYCVSVNATTGTGKLQLGSSSSALSDYFKRVRNNTSKKFIVGFGISSAEHVKNILPQSDGVVIGSALLKAIADAKTPQAVAVSCDAFWKDVCSGALAKN